MIAEILSTGDEIRTGAVVDSNAAYIAERMEDMGFFVARHTCVGDDKKAIIDALLEIGKRSEVAIVTGGLGPTVDDLTAEAAAEAASQKLIFDEAAFENIKKILKSIKRKINPSNKKQAMLPEFSQRIDNNFGTAPGFMMKIEKASVFFLPGVPFEMKKMFNKIAAEKLNNINGLSINSKTLTIKTFGLPESYLNEKIKDFEKNFDSVQVGFRAIFPEIHIKLYSKNENIEILESDIDLAEKWVAERVGGHIFAKGKNSSIEKALAEVLIKNEATISVAESCTGGLISHMLTNVSGSSAYFLFSVITYSNESKMKVLGVSENTIIEHGAVSIETAIEMAEGVKKISGATYGLSVTGIAGPTGGTEEKPVGTVCVGVATREKVYGFKFNFIFEQRHLNKKIFATAAIDKLRRIILDSSEN